MKKNYSELIKSKKERTLTAKGYRFVCRCIDLIADQRNSNRYASEMKPIKNKLRVIMDDLIIDKEMNIKEIKKLIKNRNKRFIK